MRFLVIAALSCQQYLAVSLIYAAVPVVLRQAGAPLELVGLFGLVFFAFTVNFLWAPLVDRYRLTALGRRRSWILAMQLGAALTLLGTALLKPERDQIAILAVSLLLATLAATQRIATLGYVSEVLRPDERSLGAALVGWGGALGNVLGGAACLYLIEAYGWTPAIAAFGLLMALLAGTVFAIAEPAASAAGDTKTAGALLEAFTRRDIWSAVVVIAPATFGIAIAFAMVQPRLVDLGFGLTEIGTAVAAANLLAFTLVGPLAGVLARRALPLRAIVLGGLLLAPGFLLLVPAGGRLGPEAAALVSLAFVFCALAVQTIAFNTFFFSLARPGEAATDVTFLTAMMSAIALAGFAASGFLVGALGYEATFLVAGAGYLATAGLAGLRLRSAAWPGAAVGKAGP